MVAGMGESIEKYEDDYANDIGANKYQIINGNIS